MDSDIARIVASTSMRAARDLGDLVSIVGDTNPLLKSNLTKLVYEVMETVVSPTLDAFPDLKSEVERSISMHGRAF